MITEIIWLPKVLYVKYKFRVSSEDIRQTDTLYSDDAFYELEYIISDYSNATTINL